MNQLPAAFLRSLQDIPGFDEDSFVQVHESSEPLTSVRINPLKLQIGDCSLPVKGPVPWSPYGYYLSERPFFTFDPLWHAGAYYVQEASSMFLEQALRQCVDLSQPLRVLDLCAAPGGKSTLLQSIISPDSLLVSNEVIRQRAGILEENLTKWGASNVVIIQNDPEDLSRFENFFDVIVIDAPCSGSGLFRREPEAINQWSENLVQLCSMRQQRILADIYPALKQNGLLVYSTCSYSREENEDIADWICEQFEVESLLLHIHSSWGIIEVQSPGKQAWGYRFFPDKVKGEGLFLSCFRKKDGDTYSGKPPKASKWQKATRQEEAIIRPWLRDDPATAIWKREGIHFAVPSPAIQDIITLADKLYLRKAGVTLGKIAGTDLVPEHGLAVSNLVSGEIVVVSLNQAEALQYLRKENVIIDTSHKGRALVQFSGIHLGWINILSNRINNYYPVAWRILKSGSN